MQCHTKLKHHWTIMKLIILDNVQLHKLFDDRKLLHGGVVTRNKRKYICRPLFTILGRVVQKRIGIKDNPGSSPLQSTTVLLQCIFRTTLTPTIMFYLLMKWLWVQMNPSNYNWRQMCKGQNFFGRLSTVYEIKEIFFMKPHHQHRAVTKMSSCQVYVTSRRGIVQLGSSFGST